VKKELQNKFLNYIKTRKWKNIDIDWKYGSQCVDLARDYSIYMFWENFNPHWYAKNLWYWNWGKNWELIPYKSWVIPKPWDLVIWWWPWTKYGHIAIILKADNKWFTVLEQNTGNWDWIGYDDRTRINTYPYIWYKKWVMIEWFVRNKMLEDSKWIYETIYWDNLWIRDYDSLYKAIKNDNNPKEAIYAIAIIAKSVLVNLEKKWQKKK